MNICMFTNTYLPHVGGVARSVHFFARDLRKMGHRVLVAAPEFDGQKPEEDVVRLPAIQNFNGSDFSVRIPLPFVVEQEVDAFKPDIIHSHHPFLLGDTALRVSRKKRLPLVFTHHTLYEQYTHYVPGHSGNMADFVIKMSTSYANLCNGVIAPSRSIQKLVLKRGVEQEVRVIPTGVDLGFFTHPDASGFRRAHDIPEKVFVLGHLGRLAPEKNLEFLYRTARRCLKKDSNLFFLIAGDGPFRDVLAKEARQDGLGDRVILSGKVTGEDLRDAYGAMDLFVFTSRSETQGMVITEAMAAGLPVVALDASGVREVVKEGQNGRLLAADASEEYFADAVLTLRKNPAKLDAMKKAAKETARKFSRGVSAKKMESVYTKLLQKGTAKMPEADTDPFSPLDAIMRRIQVEWDLLSRKAEAAMKLLESG